MSSNHLLKSQRKGLLLVAFLCLAALGATYYKATHRGVSSEPIDPLPSTLVNDFSADTCSHPKPNTDNSATTASEKSDSKSKKKRHKQKRQSSAAKKSQAATPIVERNPLDEPIPTLTD